MIVRVALMLGLCASCSTKKSEVASWPPHLHEHPRIEGIPCPYAKERDWQRSKKSNETISQDREDARRVGGYSKTRAVYRRGDGLDDQQ